MEKEKVIIFGLGSGYKKREAELSDKFDIIAVTDNREKGEGAQTEECFIFPDEIQNLSYDRIIVCSIKYFETLKYQLINDYQAMKEKIFCVNQVLACKNNIDEEVEKEIFETVKSYTEKNSLEKFSICNRDMWLICHDRNDSAGHPQEHYFAQDIWGAKKIYRHMPKDHYDIGSRLDGFLAHLIVFLDHVNYIDIRPLPYQIPGLNFRQGDATTLKEVEDDSIESLSSFHAIEHFGLGRYGDPVNPDACFQALRAFVRVLKPGGHLYLGVPIGPQDKLVFNAHRIFHPMTIINELVPLALVDFQIITGNNMFTVKVDEDKIVEYVKGIPEYSCGLFEFVK